MLLFSSQRRVGAFFRSLQPNRNDQALQKALTNVRLNNIVSYFVPFCNMTKVNLKQAIILLSVFKNHIIKVMSIIFQNVVTSLGKTSMQGLNHVLGSDSVYYFFLILKGLRLPIILDFIFLVCKMQKTELCQYLSFFFLRHKGLKGYIR